MTDLKKLKRFAQIIGVPVVKAAGAKSDAGLFVYDGVDSHIVLHKPDVMSLLHELGHALDWIQMGRPEADNVAKQLEMRDSQMKRKDRYVIWDYERRAINKMNWLHNLLQLEIPKEELEAETLHDLWAVNEFYRNGKYPPLRTRRKKYKWFLNHCKRKK